MDLAARRKAETASRGRRREGISNCSLHVLRSPGWQDPGDIDVPDQDQAFTVLGLNLGEIHSGSRLEWVQSVYAELIH